MAPPSDEVRVSTAVAILMQVAVEFWMTLSMKPPEKHCSIMTINPLNLGKAARAARKSLGKVTEPS